MSKRQHILQQNIVEEYANSRRLDMHTFSPYHMRVDDHGYVSVDLWTTGRYYVAMCDYSFLDDAIPTRGGEKGQITQEEITPFLDKLFFGNEEIGQYVA